jgi:hypothetical protein
MTSPIGIPIIPDLGTEPSIRAALSRGIRDRGRRITWFFAKGE